MIVIRIHQCAWDLAALFSSVARTILSQNRNCQRAKFVRTEARSGRRHMSSCSSNPLYAAEGPARKRNEAFEKTKVTSLGRGCRVGARLPQVRDWFPSPGR